MTSESAQSPFFPSPTRDSPTIHPEAVREAEESRDAKKPRIVTTEEVDQLHSGPEEEHGTTISAALPEAGVSLEAKKDADEDGWVGVWKDESKDEWEDDETEEVGSYDVYADLFPKKEKGTTALAFVCKDGVMVAVDNAPASNNGKTFAENIIFLNSHLLVALTGEIKNPGSVLEHLQDQYDREVGEETHSIEEEWQWVAKTLSSCIDRNLFVRILIAVWDKKANEPRLYFLDGDTREWYQGNCCAAGSALVTVQCGFSRHSFHFDMTSDEAVIFAQKLIHSATRLNAMNFEDGYGGDLGGFVSGYFVGAYGCGEVFSGPVGEAQR